MNASLRRGVLLGIVAVLAAGPIVACGGDDEVDEDTSRGAETNSGYVPAEAPTQPPLPPGAGQRPPPPPPAPTSTQDAATDRAAPPADSGVTDAPSDVQAQ
jgi:hypothetical protein